MHVVEAKELMKMDIGVLGKGKSDPYALITVGAQQFRTPIINNTVSPKWDYWCEVSSLFIQIAEIKYDFLFVVWFVMMTSQKFCFYTHTLKNLIP